MDSLRQANIARVLRLLRDGGPSSRADLARGAGLAKATVGTIVALLTEVGAVTEGPAATTGPGRGRPSTPVTLSGQTLVGLGIEVNVDYVSITAVDLAGRMITLDEVRRRHPSPAEVVELVAHRAARIDAEGRTLLGVTIAVPGLIDRAGGRVVDAPNLGWRELPLAAAVAAGLPAALDTDSVSVAIDNDANCAARAEALHGVAAGTDDFVYLTGTVGLGAGIISHGRAVRGRHGFAGEVGHLRVGASEAVCGCGRTGCWEAQAGLHAIAEATGVPIGEGEDPMAYAARLATLDLDLVTALAPIGQALGAGISQLAVTLDPALIVLGGAFVPLTEALVPACREALAESFSGGDCRIEASSLSLHAASLGAAVDALEETWSGTRPLVR